MGANTGRGIGGGNGDAATAATATGSRPAILMGAGIGNGSDTALIPHGVAGGGGATAFH